MEMLLFNIVTIMGIDERINESDGSETLALLGESCDVWS